MSLYTDFIEHCESLGMEFPCTGNQFYHRAESFVFDPHFVGSDYEDEGYRVMDKISMIHDLCRQGGVDIE
jgi:hypothetical protein